MSRLCISRSSALGACLGCARGAPDVAAAAVDADERTDTAELPPPAVHSNLSTRIVITPNVWGECSVRVACNEGERGVKIT